MDSLVATITGIALDTFHLFFFFAGWFCLFVGLLLLLLPDWLFRLNHKLSRTISTRRALKPVEVPIRAPEHLVYRHHRLVGLTLIFLSSYILYAMLFTLPLHDFARTMVSTISLSAWLWLLHAMQLIFVLSSSLILVFGYLIFSRPSQLKAFEQQANRWISSRQALHFLDVSHDSADRAIARHPRLWGLFVILGAIFILFTIKWP